MGAKSPDGRKPPMTDDPIVRDHPILISPCLRASVVGFDVSQ
jgi:hypothetical protein